MTIHTVRVLGLSISVLLLVASCGEDGKQPVLPVAPGLTYSAYAHFDTSGYRIVQTRYNDDSCRPELFLWWEKNFGEPFTDMNGNGVYDRGVDVFVRSSNPEINQDLNYNGRYDPPDGYWDGTPFDDLDNNGICRQEFPYDGWYNPGTPFADFNGNGMWDYYPPYNYEIVSFIAEQVDSATTRYSWRRPSSALSITSDSGVTYSVPLDTGYFETHCPLGSFTISDSALLYTIGDYKVIPVLLLSDRSPGIDTVIGEWHDSWFSALPIRREISLGTTLILAGDTLRGLLRVVCDSLQFGNPSDASSHKGAYFEFYLSDVLGPIAVVGHPLNADWLYSARFDRRIDSIPIPLIR